MAQEGAARGSGWLTGALVTLGLVLVVVGGVSWWREGSVASSPRAGGPAAGTPEKGTPRGQQVVPTVKLPKEQRVRTRPGAPKRLVVPRLSISAPIVPIGAPGGVLTPPADPQVLGWWADGARPGAARGSALVTGHTVHSGGGAMDHLERLKRGDRVWMRTDRGRIGYAVRQVAVLGKGELARRAQRVFDQDVQGRLVLITCEDWNGVEYLSNVVVTAVPVA